MIDSPRYKSVPTFRNYEDYHDAEQYTKGWNDAMDYIFPESKKAREKESMKKKFDIIKAETEAERMASASTHARQRFTHGIGGQKHENESDG